MKWFVCLRARPQSRSHTYSQLSGSFLPDSLMQTDPRASEISGEAVWNFFLIIFGLVFLNFSCLFESFIVAALNLFSFFVVLVVILLFVVVFGVFVVFLFLCVAILSLCSCNFGFVFVFIYGVQNFFDVCCFYFKRLLLFWVFDVVVFLVFVLSFSCLLLLFLSLCCRIFESRCCLFVSDTVGFWVWSCFGGFLFHFKLVSCHFDSFRWQFERLRCCYKL